MLEALVLAEVEVGLVDLMVDLIVDLMVDLVDLVVMGAILGYLIRRWHWC